MIDNFFNEQRKLDKNRLYSQSMTSRIAIDALSLDDISYFHELFRDNIEILKLYSWLFDEETEYDEFYSISEFRKIYSSIYYKELFISFIDNKFHLWKPNGNEFYVVFGAPELIEKIKPDMFSLENYIEILNEDTGLSEQGRKYMLNALESYGGFND